MGFGFRKSIRIAPGVKLNLSKSGVSASFGVKGFTYNTRGRITTSIPGTGIYHTQNLRTGQGVTARGRHAVTQRSTRAQGAADFGALLQERSSAALKQYFRSHGIFVGDEDIDEALALDAHRAFIDDLETQFKIVVRAIRLVVDNGSISLAEREKALTALYVIEDRCAEQRGESVALDEVASALESSALAWPQSPSFVRPFILALLGCLMLVAQSDVAALLFCVAACWAAAKLFVFERRKAKAKAEIAGLDARFSTLVRQELSPRPVAPQTHDKAFAKALAGAVLVGLLAWGASSQPGVTSTHSSRETVPAQHRIAP